MKLHHDYNPWRAEPFHRHRRQPISDLWIRTSRMGKGQYHWSPKDINAVLTSASMRSTYVSIDAGVMEGKPCIAGTRVPVASVLRAIEQYGSIDSAVMCYPHISPEHVKDALYFTQLVLESADGIDETAVAP